MWVYNECICVCICRHLYLLSLYDLQHKWLQDPVSLHILLNTSHFLFPATFFVYRWESWRSDNLKESPKITQTAKRRGKSLPYSSPLFIHKGFIEPHAPVIREKLRRDGNELWGMGVKIIQKVERDKSPLTAISPGFLTEPETCIWWCYLGQWWWAHLCYCWVLITNWQLFWVHTRLGTKPKTFMYYLIPLN